MIFSGSNLKINSTNILMKPHVKVVCAIIHKKNKVLAVQRSEKMTLPLKWEFPGGKIELEESEMDCIKREIEEELKIEIKVGQRLTPSYYEYPNFTIELIPYLSEYKSGNLTLQEHSRFLLLNKDELKNLDWAEADVPIVNEYINYE